MTVLVTDELKLTPLGATLGGAPHGICHGHIRNVGDASGGSQIAGFLIGTDNILLRIDQYVVTREDGGTIKKYMTDLLPNLLNIAQVEIDHQPITLQGSFSLQCLEGGKGLYIWRETTGTIIQTDTQTVNGMIFNVHVQGVYWYMAEMRERGLVPLV